MPAASLAHRLGMSMIRAWFMATFMSSVVAAGVLCRLTHFMFFLSKKRRQQLSAQVAGLCFRVIFALNPQIAIEHVSKEEEEPAWDELFTSADGSSTATTLPIVLINHTSPLDSIFYSACVPTRQIQHLRTLAKSSLFKIPGFGQILDACGHFPVFFASEKAQEGGSRPPLTLASSGGFSVDKQAQERVQRDIEAYLQEGGGLSMFPEGQLNKDDCRSLQTFRRGSLALAKDRKMAVWGFLHTGIDRIWPVKDQFGGNPGKIRFKLFKLDIPSSVHDAEELNVFVHHVERLMQLELDLMHAIDEHDENKIGQQNRLLQEELEATAHGDAALEAKLAHAVKMHV